jgi:hypothetical protein
LTTAITRRPRVPDSEKCWALIERVAGSSQLKRAPRLQELLFYISRRSIKEGCERVHEQEIGTQVFGRPETYDTSYDNIVRTNISDLRKRIEHYFNSEGRQEKLIMELPRGSYVPVFRFRLEEPEIETGPLAENDVATLELPATLPVAPSVVIPRPWAPRVWAALGIFVLLIAIGCAFLFWGRYRALHRALYAWQDESSMSDLWSRILTANPETDVVLSDDSIGLAQALSNQTVPLKDYLGRSYISQLQNGDLNPDKQAAVNRILGWNLGSPEEFSLARRILDLDPLNRHFRLYNARFYMAESIRLDNVILIGARKSNPWVELFEDRTNFVIEFGANGITVENRSPAPGEQKSYAQSDFVHYCVVAFLPNPEHNGIVLLIEGTNAEATEAAGDFLLSEDQLSSFKKTLHASTFPYFEALLKVSSVRGTPFTSTVEGYRTYPNLH